MFETPNSALLCHINKSLISTTHNFLQNLQLLKTSNWQIWIFCKFMLAEYSVQFEWSFTFKKQYLLKLKQKKCLMYRLSVQYNPMYTYHIQLSKRYCYTSENVTWHKTPHTTILHWYNDNLPVVVKACPDSMNTSFHLLIYWLNYEHFGFPLRSHSRLDAVLAIKW